MTEWTDEMILSALHLRDQEGLSAEQIGGRFGASRSAVCGVFKRIADAELPCECERPENRDGGMPAGWWRLAAAQRRASEPQTHTPNERAD